MNLTFGQFMASFWILFLGVLVVYFLHWLLRAFLEDCISESTREWRDNFQEDIYALRRQLNFTQSDTQIRLSALEQKRGKK